MDNHLTIHFLSIVLCCSNVAVFPDLSYYFGEYTVTITDRNCGQNRTLVVINHSYPLNACIQYIYNSDRMEHSALAHWSIYLQ